MSSAGIIPDQSAQRASAVRGRIGAKRQTVSCGGVAQPVQNDSGLNARKSRAGIDHENPIHVFGEIQHDGNIAALPGEARAGSPRQNRGAIRSACGDGCNHIFVVTRNHQPNRNPAIIRSIKGIECATASVETHLALHRSSELFLQLRSRSERIDRLTMGAERKGREWLQRCWWAGDHGIHDETAGCTTGLALALGSEGLSSIFIQRARIAPHRSKAMLPPKGNSQLPVRSMIMPAKTSEMMSAKSDPESIKPLAHPDTPAH